MGADEEFSSEQRALLQRYVSNTEGDIFVLRNLPEVIKGALFSRYSRSPLGLRTLLLKEFILGSESSFEAIAPSCKEEEQSLAIKKAQNFYDRILDGYGDDSIGELGGAHLAVENISMLGAKFLETPRIGGSPLEKSTRYIPFDQKVKGRYLYYLEPTLMTSRWSALYKETCDHLFETYSALIPPVTELFEKQHPYEEGSSKAAHTSALRAKVLDVLRGLLPAGTLTNLGLFGNGRFFEALLHKLSAHPHAELRGVGKGCFEELNKVIPSFVRRAETSHPHHKGFAQFYASASAQLKALAEQHPLSSEESTPGAHLIGWDPEGPVEVAAALLYPEGHHSLENLRRACRNWRDGQLTALFEELATLRANRRHKSPRALEHASFTFDMVADFGIYRDLQRHRLLTQERQLLTCNLGYYSPPELEGTAMEGPYKEAMERAQEAYGQIASSFAEEAQYIVPMAFNVRWYFHVNLRALQWITELRSQAAGHSTYRLLAQQMAKEVMGAVPSFASFFKFVDFNGYDLGRLGQERRKMERLKAL